MLVPVSAVLVLAALSVSRQPYTGITLREDRVVAVVRGSPADRAGFAPGDRLIAARANAIPQNPLALAAPGEPLALLRERAGHLDAIRLVPQSPPESERRVLVLLLAVACGFVVLGGWVWSERRDGLTRPFHLLCLALAVMLAPMPRFRAGGLAAGYEALYAAATLFVPALFVHFFALFPGALRLEGRARLATALAYAVSTVLFGASLGITAAAALAPGRAAAASSLLQMIAALWFALGCLSALLLFAFNYRRRHTPDERRRMRVALVGTVLGAAPLAGVIVVRNLFPSVAVPWERASVLLTLLVPVSFAWAMAVHQVFEFRVALRAGVIVGLLGLAAGLTFLLGEWVAGAWRADLGTGIAGGALACLAVVASAAGPANSGLRRLGTRLLPAARAPSLGEWVAPSALAHARRPDAILIAACDAARRALRLDACAAWTLEPGVARAVNDPATAPALRLSAGLPTALGGARGLLAADDPRLPPSDRGALAGARISWLLPIGDRPRAALLLGRRLGGPWLSLREVADLERFSEHLDVLLENAALREAASSHDHLDRELTRAGALQARLLPRAVPRTPALDCAAATLSSEPVGGDYWDVVEEGEDRVTLAIGDAAGKGVPAALMGVWAQATFRSHARRGARPGRVLAALNRELVALEQPQSFVALLCAQLDLRRGELRFANAGLTPPLLHRPDGPCRELTASGVLLGVVPGARYQDTRVPLRAGDLVVLYTDGVTEARRGDELFGTERLQATLETCADLPAAGIVGRLIEAVREFADHPLDDLTVVVIRPLARSGAAIRARRNGLKLQDATADLTR
jgi:serine phosphatase RsbU (regulator of sigma subunit)